MANAWDNAAAAGGGNPWMVDEVLAPAFGMGPHDDDDGPPAAGAAAVAIGAAHHVLPPFPANFPVLPRRAQGGRGKKHTRKARRHRKSRRSKKSRRPRRKMRTRRRR